MLVTVVGISAVLATRVERRTVQDANDLTEARLYAESAIETGMYLIQSDSHWRTNRPNGNWQTNISYGSGKYTLAGVDPTDGDLTDSQSEPVLFTGTGTVRNATYIVKATANANPIPLDALKKSVAANGDITINLLKSFTVTGAPMATNGKLVNFGTVNGAVETVVAGTVGTVTGLYTAGAPTLTMPDANLINNYIAVATTIPTGDIDKRLLTPGSNPWGTANTDGVYFMNAVNTDVTVKQSRIWGTLIIRINAGRKVTFADPNLIQNYRADYPAIIVDGAADFSMTSSTTSLMEASSGTNFNPANSPYLGAWNANTLDTYPNEVWGLVHIRGNTSISASTRFHGSILTEGTFTVKISGAEVDYDSSIFNNKIVGYSTYQMTLTRGTWERVVNP